MIRLTRIAFGAQTPVYINPDNVAWVGVGRDHTFIEFTGGADSYVEVIESPEKVVRLIDEKTRQ